MNLSKKFCKNFLQKSFAIYGLGKTGSSTLKFLKEKKITSICIWDDNLKIRDKYNQKKKNSEISFKKKLKLVDFIVISPGISIEKSSLKKELLKNKHKIITDLDIFYILNPRVKSIIVTGTNGKSTTCKIIQHILATRYKNVYLGGNIGKPILDLKFNKNSIAIIEASSFQLAYSNYIRAKYAILLNISNDHLDWHITKSNYINSKFRIFKNQKKSDFAFLDNKQLVNIYKKKKLKGNLNIISNKNFKLIKIKIKNIYFETNINNQNLVFAYHLIKKLKISDNTFINSMNTFKGLDHRYQIIYKNKFITCINDSKATSFEATKHALMNSKNIYWILGGLPKKGDIFNFKNFKKNIIRGYVIGRNINFYKKNLKKKIDFVISKTLQKAIIQICFSIKYDKKKNKVILFSPSAASYDQYKNFEERGDEFKKLIKLYARKHF